MIAPVSGPDVEFLSMIEALERKRSIIFMIRFYEGLQIIGFVKEL